ncbi:hypothetical protein [uncultured Arsenicicoccus sp.]|uniref:hypothetical protein n=1 Tax=uncultured Arsenicicoccus sp. TaxID=491339 RepID=UPI00259749FF|nr:hypothetical protein [uncultured Arsenicicoccus sp.]
MTRPLSPTAQRLARAFPGGITAGNARLVVAAHLLVMLGDTPTGVVALSRLADSDLVDDLAHLIYPDARKET